MLKGAIITPVTLELHGTFWAYKELMNIKVLTNGKELHSVSVIGYPETSLNFIPSSIFPSWGQNKYIDPFSLDKNREYD